MAKDDPTATAGNTRDEIHAIILNYLKRMGFRQTEHAFRDEARTTANLDTLAFELRNDQDASISNYLLFSNGGTGKSPPPTPSAAIYEQTYEALRKWILGSLDSIREELMALLFPIYIHCFLDLVAKGMASEASRFLAAFYEEHQQHHGEELERLRSVQEPMQLRENGLAATFRTCKYNVVMSAYAFQLLMTYLQEGALSNTSANGAVLVLKIINQFINVRVLVSKSGGVVHLHAQTSTGSSIILGTGITGHSMGATIAMNKEAIYWGVNPVSSAVDELLASANANSNTAGTKRAKDATGKPLTTVATNSAIDSLSTTVAQLKRAYAASMAKAPPADRIPQPELADAPTELLGEIGRLRDLGRRAILASSSANIMPVRPSICCYTLHNSYEGVNCLQFSPDHTILASASRHSHIDLWSLTREPLRALRPSTELAAMDLGSGKRINFQLSIYPIEESESLRESTGSTTKRLVGHSGPVYGLSFVPNSGQFLLSASQDRTVRLWSTEIFGPVAVYRSHSLPVWDVDCAPSAALGPYWASASADRTARLWSLERIQPLRVFAGHLSDVDVVRFHPNGNYIGTASADRTVRLWDLPSGRAVRLLTGHERSPTALSISPDGRILASGDRQGSIKLWDLGEGRLLRTLGRPKVQQRGSSLLSSVYSLSFCQDGRLLAAGTADCIVSLWDVGKATATTNEEALVGVYPTKNTPVTQVTFSRRNVLVVGGSYAPDDVSGGGIGGGGGVNNNNNNN